MSELERFFASVRGLADREEAADRYAWLPFLLDAYTADTGGACELPLSSADQKRLREWLQLTRAEDPFLLIDGFSVQRSVREQVFFLTVAEKASYLLQTSCFRCAPDHISPHSSVFPVMVPPITTQSATSDGRALHKARVANALIKTHRSIEAEFGKRQLCVSVATFLGQGVRKKDADNLCKAILDDMQGIIYENDAAIRHLQSFRFLYEGSVSGHMIRVAGVQGDDAGDVLDRSASPIALSGVPDF